MKKTIQTPKHNLNDPHFVCQGECKGVSEDQNAKCQTKSCSNYSQQLSLCKCKSAETAQE